MRRLVRSVMARSGDRPVYRLVIGVLVMALAGTLLCFSIVRVAQQEIRAATMIRATGTSLGYSAAGHGRNADRWAGISFKTEDGRIVKTRYAVVAEFLVPEAGAPLEILYDPREPGAVLPASAFQRLLAPLAGLLTTLFGLLMGAALAFGGGRPARRQTRP